MLAIFRIKGNAMKINRRQFIKAQAAATAAATAGISLNSEARNLITTSKDTELEWNKAPCRFCGTGCSIQVATKDVESWLRMVILKAKLIKG
jgi:anaerobic selenocysteine-containing dehydrogenase